MAIGNSTTETLEIDSTTGGSLTDYTDEALDIGDFEIENDQTEDTPFGTAAAKHSFTGTYGAKPFTVTCEVDSGVGSLYKVLKAARGTTRTVKRTFITGEYVSCECNVGAFKTGGKVKGISQGTVTFTPTGTITES